MTTDDGLEPATKAQDDKDQASYNSGDIYADNSQERQRSDDAFKKGLRDGLTPYEAIANVFTPGFDVASQWTSEWLLPLRLVHHLSPRNRFLELYFILEYLVTMMHPESADQAQTNSQEAVSASNRIRDALGDGVNPATLDRAMQLRNTLLHGQVDSIEASELHELTGFLRKCIGSIRGKLSETCELVYMLDPIKQFPPRLKKHDPIYLEIVLFELRRHSWSYFSDKHFDQESAKSIIGRWLRKAAV